MKVCLCSDESSRSPQPTPASGLRGKRPADDKSSSLEEEGSRGKKGGLFFFLNIPRWGRGLAVTSSSAVPDLDFCRNSFFLTGKNHVRKRALWVFGAPPKNQTFILLYGCSLNYRVHATCELMHALHRQVCSFQGKIQPKAIWMQLNLGFRQFGDGLYSEERSWRKPQRSDDHITSMPTPGKPCLPGDDGWNVSATCHLHTWLL